MRIVVIPDTQIKVGVPTNHLTAAGNYIVKHKPDVVVVIGDWWDMESLSSFNSKKMVEGLRVKEDLDAGYAGLDLFMEPLVEYNANQRRNKKKTYNPRLVFTVGNHDPQVRIPRYLEEHPTMSGMLDGEEATRALEEYGFEVYPFLEVVEIEGIRFAHYHVNSHSAKKAPLGGNADSMLKNAGFSIIQGHTQGLKIAKHYLGDGTPRLCIVAGSFYQHKEDYMGVQGNEHWQGIIVLNEVSNGGGDICEVSLNYLLREYL